MNTLDIPQSASPELVVSLSAIPVLVLSAVGLLSDGPATPPYFVLLHNYEVRDCQTGKKTHAKSAKSSTVVEYLGNQSSLLRLFDMAGGREICIKAGLKDLLSVKPQEASDGAVAWFVDQRTGIRAPRVKENRSIMTAQERFDLLEDIYVSVRTFVILVVEKDGKVSSCEVLRSSGHAAWDRAAKDLFCGPYEPGKQNGKPVATTLVRMLSN